jgi:3-methyladenine DNA glycosylase/8-oxoguanine DNA glycosylase
MVYAVPLINEYYDLVEAGSRAAIAELFVLLISLVIGQTVSTALIVTYLNRFTSEADRERWITEYRESELYRFKISRKIFEFIVKFIES